MTDPNLETALREEVTGVVELRAGLERLDERGLLDQDTTTDTTQ
ncbi:hypothetical protein GCM10012275_55140 [Longimycelium tulufanense]|uniref:Uncharacterized protein n=1 Tax=Longimycelium tulufanense TaxID=907463 RepID=A0A8J3CKL2_9PSEU|nr:hypothetical protein [Longimycelium tulufanense]GGM77423.1 hypothetical protein GCM10012275_55140 [Longimycelium tulufanense]